MKKQIPNIITLMNLSCGVVGIVCAFNMRIDLALYLMLGASLFDFLDGAAARLLGAYSDLGKELDSLCDMVSFGVLPSVMMYKISTEIFMGQHWSCYAPLLISIFSAYRLAKFNIDSRQSDSFLGLPTPACAILIGAISYYLYTNPLCTLLSPLSICITIAVLCILLVCELPMFSIKFHKTDPSSLRIKRLAMLVIVLLSIIACLVFKLNWSVALIFTFLAYILKNLLYAILKI